MGCIPSKNDNVHSYEFKRVEGILSKSINDTTEDDIEQLKNFIKQYENKDDMSKPLMLLHDVQTRIDACTNSQVYEVSEYDRTVAKLKSEMNKLKNRIKRLEGEKTSLVELAKSTREVDLTASIHYAKQAKSKSDQIKKTYAYMDRISNNLNSLDEANVNAEMLKIMNNTADTLEKFSKEIGTVDDIQDLNDRLRGLEDNLTEMNQVMFGDDMSDIDIEDFDELDRSIAQDKLEGLEDVNYLDSPKVNKKETNKETRVLETE